MEMLRVKEVPLLLKLLHHTYEQRIPFLLKKAHSSLWKY